MTATGFIGGHAVWWDGRFWRWTDTGTPADDARPCPACGQLVEPGQPDPCLGWIEGLRSACCGHGVHDPYRVGVDE